MNAHHWRDLLVRAQAVVEEVMEELPPEILAEAKKVPCLFEERNAEDRDLMGIYGDFAPGEVSNANGPIVLYLAAIDEFCDDDGSVYEDEVRLTYLHELGHHFGWDEGDLEERGLG